jgi:tetratricopeptide (TPR) repeat protein
MKKAIAAAALVAGFLLVAPSAQAQTGTARGRVVDAQGQPIADAKVLIEFQGGVTRKFEVKTNKKGEFMQVGMQPGQYRFTVSKEGYQGGTADQRISLGDPTEVPEFKLSTTAEAAKQGAGGAAAEQLKGDFQKAVELHNAGKLDEAEAAYKAILAAHPDVPEVYRNLGAIYLTKKNYTEAETALQKGLELRPTPESTSLLAQVYQESGQADKALALLEKSAGSNPTDVKAQFNRGIFLLNANKNEEAQAAFEAAIKADPSFAESYYRLGALMIGQGKIPDAVQNLEKYLSLNPTDKQNVATAQGLLKALKK